MISELDTMQVCRNGHVITDRLRSDPDSGRAHCDRCGAATVDHCATCGAELPAAAAVAGLVPIGSWPAPRSCPQCGAVFPWGRKPVPGPEAVASLEMLLRRLPLVIRQLRWRHGERPPFTVDEPRDLEDLVRSLLPLRFDDVRLESRTPTYSATTRTDLLLAPQRIAVTIKLATGLREMQLLEQGREDIAYYSQRGDYRWLVLFIYDPEGLLRDARLVNSLAAEAHDDLEVRVVVGIT